MAIALIAESRTAGKIKKLITEAITTSITMQDVVYITMVEKDSLTTSFWLGHIIKNASELEYLTSTHKHNGQTRIIGYKEFDELNTHRITDVWVIQLN